MRIAIMQPYTFPYLGYFQLINAVDTFVFYDDVNFIKRGWINRNNILVNGQASLFTIPLLKASQNKQINEVEFAFDQKWRVQFFKSIEYNYKNAPFYKNVRELLEQLFSKDFNNIADLAIESVIMTSNFLGLNTNFKISSKTHGETNELNRADRLITICHLEGANDYINPNGGKELYQKEYFSDKNVNLFFIQNDLVPYNQNIEKFVPGLSIIDVLMFNSVEEVQKMLTNYILE